MCLAFSSCMNTEILPLKFYKEEFPLKIDDNFIMSDLVFNKYGRNLAESFGCRNDI